MKSNFELQGLANPVVSTNKPMYASVYVPNKGRLELFKRRVKIVRGVWNHTYMEYKGMRICPVHKQGRQWVISTGNETMEQAKARIMAQQQQSY